MRVVVVVAVRVAATLQLLKDMILRARGLLVLQGGGCRKRRLMLMLMLLLVLLRGRRYGHQSEVISLLMEGDVGAYPARLLQKIDLCV